MYLKVAFTEQATLAISNTLVYYKYGKESKN